MIINADPILLTRAIELWESYRLPGSRINPCPRAAFNELPLGLQEAWLRNAMRLPVEPPKSVS